MEPGVMDKEACIRSIWDLRCVFRGSQRLGPFLQVDPVGHRGGTLSCNFGLFRVWFSPPARFPWLFVVRPVAMAMAVDFIVGPGSSTDRGGGGVCVVVAAEVVVCVHEAVPCG